VQHAFLLRLGGGVGVVGGNACTNCRACARGQSALTFRAGAVARLLHGSLDGCGGFRGIGAFCELHFHRVLQQVHGNACYAGNLLGSFFDPRRARRAGHTSDVKLNFHYFPYFEKRLMSCMASSITSVSPWRTRSVTQVSRWLRSSISETVCTALSAAESCVSTSPQ